MKNILLYMIGAALLISCSSIKPKGFTSVFEDKYTGLDTLINIEGYYSHTLLRYPELYRILMFYNNGLLMTTTSVHLDGSDVSDYFLSNNDGSKFQTWGVYSIKDSIISIQLIETDGWLERSYVKYVKCKILPSQDIVNISDYVIIKQDSIYGSRNIINSKTAEFYPLVSKCNYNECPWLKKKWFYKRK